ncbi:MAG: anthranilate synthase component I [Chloroflexi bacterium AL-W]|nr:anthranilate synthase component I [Chloroflexi bacterium AL-N1]NOK68649.1 anthranilate synthase component I [Chloroflexi bacterium AL-N10]NOK76135.1 anthranilate synthase component I [Chloroflexi bacterium AL-N5]NOK84228.1 anthranilate synthase component I [Chloroflexi bacterium AL-W]NOK91273.1 anthranilate synthase component I [Chloroflexi bacterium AL-N15]
MHIKPSLDEVYKLRDQGNLCPIYAEILADLETPVSVFLKVARGSHSFLLESVEGGKHLARYSFIGTEPYMTLRFVDGVASAYQGGYKQTLLYTDPLVMLGSYLHDYRPVRLPDLPLFVGGAVGYQSYETVGCFERLPRPDAQGYDMPQGIWQFVDTLIAFDHLKHKMKIISHVHLDADNLEAEYGRAVRQIDELVARLSTGIDDQKLGLRRGAVDTQAPFSTEQQPGSNMTQAEYEACVLKAKEYIMAGDIFQVVPSQRFSRPVSVDSFAIYRALRTINPSPYMFYLHMPEGDLVGASPELLVRVDEGAVLTHPIAGTRPRGQTSEQDMGLAHELLSDEKERAEHLMLVDLGRNDIGRVSKPGTVRVPEFMFVEHFSHVMHLVSHVSGQLREDMSALDALRACFPAGTVSGAPKIRAMEIIAELEQEQRGVYAGAVGHVGFNGDLDTCIALRTMVVKDGVAYVQAGGGVVADSDPTAEYHESCNKAAALLRAIDEAEQLARRDRSTSEAEVPHDSATR